MLPASGRPARIRWTQYHAAQDTSDDRAGCGCPRAGAGVPDCPGGGAVTDANVLGEATLIQRQSAIVLICVLAPSGCRGIGMTGRLADHEARAGHWPIPSCCVTLRIRTFYRSGFSHYELCQTGEGLRLILMPALLQCAATRPPKPC